MRLREGLVRALLSTSSARATRLFVAVHISGRQSYYAHPLVEFAAFSYLSESFQSFFCIERSLTAPAGTNFRSSQHANRLPWQPEGTAASRE